MGSYEIILKINYRDNKKEWNQKNFENFIILIF
jgi:hypothetical protein